MMFPDALHIFSTKSHVPSHINSSTPFDGRHPVFIGERSQPAGPIAGVGEAGIWYLCSIKATAGPRRKTIAKSAANFSSLVEREGLTQTIRCNKGHPINQVKAACAYAIVGSLTVETDNQLRNRMCVTRAGHANVGGF